MIGFNCWRLTLGGRNVKIIKRERLTKIQRQESSWLDFKRRKVFYVLRNPKWDESRYCGDVFGKRCPQYIRLDKQWTHYCLLGGIGKSPSRELWITRISKSRWAFIHQTSWNCAWISSKVCKTCFKGEALARTLFLGSTSNGCSVHILHSIFVFP